MNPKSLRKRKSVLLKISSLHKKNIVSPDTQGIYDMTDTYLISADFTSEEQDNFRDMVYDSIIHNVSEYLEAHLAAQTISVADGEELVWKQPFDEVRDELWGIFDSLVLKYKGPVAALAEIAENAQNIHTHDVVRKTTDGVLLLGKVAVPEGQKTLAEIEEAFMGLLPTKHDTLNKMYNECLDHNVIEYSDDIDIQCIIVRGFLRDGIAMGKGIPKITYSFDRASPELRSSIFAAYYKMWYEKNYPLLSSIEKTIADMRDWGRRASVMLKGENVYRSTLRGLWAKIKTFEGEQKDELVKRLFEECNEAVEQCADGHVGRLCNVLVGFDPEFTCSLSPMEYFQNTIALIAENTHSNHETKIKQAVALMNEVEMPAGERQAWLDAF
jgi:hypothetical protein